MIIAACFALGLGLRLAVGGGLRSLSDVHLRGETVLLILLVVQAALPLLKVSGTSARVAYFGWLATFPLMIAIAWMNRRQPGVAILGAGLLMNLVVVAANGGMPVFVDAVAAVRPGLEALAIPTGDFVHVAGLATTRVPWLADILPLPGPSWLRVVASPGDLLLYVGIIAFLALGTGGHSSTPSRQ